MFEHPLVFYHGNNYYNDFFFLQNTYLKCNMYQCVISAKKILQLFSTLTWVYFKTEDSFITQKSIKQVRWDAYFFFFFFKCQQTSSDWLGIWQYNIQDELSPFGIFCELYKIFVQSHVHCHDKD